MEKSDKLAARGGSGGGTVEGRTSRPKAEAERRPEAVARTTHRGDYVRGRLLLRRATTSTDLNVVTLEVAVRNGCSPGAQKRTLKNSTQRKQHDSISVARNHAKMHFFRCARLQLSSTYNFALFTLLLEDDFQSETVNFQHSTVNFARFQLPSTYNFSKMGGGDNGSTK